MMGSGDAMNQKIANIMEKDLQIHESQGNSEDSLNNKKWLENYY